MEAEFGVIQPQVKKCQQPPKLEEGQGTDSSLGSLEGACPTDS